MLLLLSTPTTRPARADATVVIVQCVPRLRHDIVDVRSRALSIAVLRTAAITAALTTLAGTTADAGDSSIWYRRRRRNRSQRDAVVSAGRVQTTAAAAVGVCGR